VVVVTVALGELGTVDVAAPAVEVAVPGAALLDAAAGAELVGNTLLGAAVVVAVLAAAGDVVAGAAVVEAAAVVEGNPVVEDAAEEGATVVEGTAELLAPGAVCSTGDVSNSVDSGAGDCGTDVGAVDASLGVGAKVPVPDRPESEFDSDGIASVIGGIDGMVVAAAVGTSSFKDGGTVKVIPGGTVASGLRSTTLADN
jgi:hypothetical protein